ncbi:MAG TPA: hypothetical protein VJ652_15020 [Noviherbaspirillum sp.]|nr:hypothetical protein [Noviherbaspirillum sp.]
MTRPAIDLTRHAFVRTKGDITAYGTWLYNPDLNRTEPALVLVPTYRRRGFRPVAIALSAAFKYTDARYTANAVHQYVQDLGFDSNSTNAFKVTEIILENLPDVVEMPNDPTRAVVVGEATINLPDGKRHSAQLLDYEQER